VWPFSYVGELFIGQPEALCSVMQQDMVQRIVMDHCFEKQQDWSSRIQSVKAV
jgi:hypothetical protein